MPREVGDLSSTEARQIIKKITGQDFTYSNQRPEDAVYALRDYNIQYMESLGLEWAVKNASGIMLISEPITRLSYWNLPDDLEFGEIARDEAMNELQDQYTQYLQSIAQGIYVTNGRYGTNIKMEGDKEPRLVAFLNNHQPEEKFIAAVAAMQNLLPRLQMSA